MRVLRPALEYVGLTAGGLFAFTLLATVIRQVPFGERPGAWPLAVPALRRAGLQAGLLHFIAYGLILALLLFPAGLISAFLIRRIRRLRLSRGASRLGAAAVGAATAGYFMIVIGWSVQVTGPSLAAAVLLGAVAGLRLLQTAPDDTTDWTAPRTAV